MPSLEKEISYIPAVTSTLAPRMESCGFTKSIRTKTAQIQTRRRMVPAVMVPVMAFAAGFAMFMLKLALHIRF